MKIGILGTGITHGAYPQTNASLYQDGSVPDRFCGPYSYSLLYMLEKQQ